MFDPSQGRKDYYDRTLAYLETRGGADFGRTMVRGGFAAEYTYDTAYQRQGSYQAAEQDARAANRGLWPSAAVRTRRPALPRRPPSRRPPSQTQATTEGVAAVAPVVAPTGTTRASRRSRRTSTVMTSTGRSRSPAATRTGWTQTATGSPARAETDPSGPGWVVRTGTKGAHDDRQRRTQS